MKRIHVSISILVLMFLMAQSIVSSSVSDFDFISDLNGDLKIDMRDVGRVARGFGTACILSTEVNRTVVTVVNSARSPSEIEGALVVVNPGGYRNQKAGITNSTGKVVFDLDPNATYTVRAWSNEATSSCQFDTNSHGEASVLIILGEPSRPVICNIGPNETWITIRDNVTGEYYTGNTFDLEIQVYKLHSDKLSIEKQADQFPEYGPSIKIDWIPERGNYDAYSSYMVRIFDWSNPSAFDFRGYFQLHYWRPYYAINCVAYGNISTLE